MPFRVEEFIEGRYYHIFNRGALRNVLYYNAEMYWTFIKLVERFTETYHIRVVAICLMPNHFHIVIFVEPGGDVSRFMQRVCGTYSRRINQHLKRSGTIFQGRFGSTWIDSHEYMLEICRYIHTNPVTDSLVSNPSAWEYSNYHEVINKRNDILVDNSFIRDLFGGSDQYEEFVRRGLHAERIRSLALLKGLAKLNLV